MEGMTDKEICEKYKDFKAAQAKMEEDLPYPGGECGQDVVNRAFPLLKEIGETEFQTVAVVTHGGVIRACLLYTSRQLQPQAESAAQNQIFRIFR